jgi:hypothetical protein
LFLKHQFPDIQSGEWNEMISEGPLYGVHIRPTPKSKQRISSGHFEDAQLGREGQNGMNWHFPITTCMFEISFDTELVSSKWSDAIQLMLSSQGGGFHPEWFIVEYV